jgi:hypothetical protein
LAIGQRFKGMLGQEIANLMDAVTWIVLGYLAIGALFITVYLIVKETIGRKSLIKAFGTLAIGAFLIISIFLASFMVDMSQTLLYVANFTGLLIL